MKSVVIKKIIPAFIDDRGEISNILDAPVQHIALITSKAGTIRGNHYHPDQIQNDYLLSGKYEYTAKGVKGQNGEPETILVKPGTLVITPPMTAHAMRFLEDSVFLTFTTGPRDTDKYEEHTTKFKLI